MSSTEPLDANGRQTTAYVAGAAGDDAPGVALYHAWWGLNDDVKAFADRLADAGFKVVAPDFYRGSITAEIEEAKQLTRSVDEADADAIALAAIDRLANRPNAPGCAACKSWRSWRCRRPRSATVRIGARIGCVGAICRPWPTSIEPRSVRHGGWMPACWPMCATRHRCTAAASSAVTIRWAATRSWGS